MARWLKCNLNQGRTALHQCKEDSEPAGSMLGEMKACDEPMIGGTYPKMGGVLSLLPGPIKCEVSTGRVPVYSHRV